MKRDERAMPTIATDLAVNLQEDRPGMLASAAAAIASGGLNIAGFAEVEGIFHVLTSDPRSARLALRAAGLRVHEERDVVVIRIEDRAGAAAAVFERLASAGINIAHTYLASGNRIVIAASEPRKALEVLGA